MKESAFRQIFTTQFGYYELFPRTKSSVMQGPDVITIVDILSLKYKLFYTYLICQFNFEARLTIPGILRPHSYSAKLAILEFS